MSRAKSKWMHVLSRAREGADWVHQLRTRDHVDMWAERRSIEKLGWVARHVHSDADARTVEQACNAETHPTLEQLRAAYERQVSRLLKAQGGWSDDGLEPFANFVNGKILADFDAGVRAQACAHDLLDALEGNDPRVRAIWAEIDNDDFLDRLDKGETL